LGPLEVAEFKKFYKLNKLREVVIPGDGRCMYSSLAHQVLGKQQDTFLEQDRYNEAERIKGVALDYIHKHPGYFEGFVQTEQQEDTFQTQDHDNEAERMKGVAVDCTHKHPEDVEVLATKDVPGADRYGAAAEDVGDYVQQMASDKCSYGDEIILRATALSLKCNIRVFKYDETSTGVDTAKISTFLYAAVPDTTCQTMNQDATSDMLAEEETLKVSYYTWQGQGFDGHYNTFVEHVQMLFKFHGNIQIFLIIFELVLEVFMNCSNFLNCS
jgi:hypothetical protein